MGVVDAGMKVLELLEVLGWMQAQGGSVDAQTGVDASTEAKEGDDGKKL